MIKYIDWRTELGAMRIQRALKSLGIYDGRVDGVFGTLSKKALREFQRMNNLVDDGIPGIKTQDALFPTTIPDRVGLNTPVRQQALPKAIHAVWPRQSDVPGFYGNVDTIPRQLVSVTPPYPLWYAGNLNQRIRTFQLHNKVAQSAERVLERTLEHYGIGGIRKLNLDVFGGSYVKRKMRGGSNWSMHAYGIAIDFDPANNTLRQHHDTAKFAKPEYKDWWRFWREEGWLGLGPAKDYDWMHVQAAIV